MSEWRWQRLWATIMTLAVVATACGEPEPDPDPEPEPAEDMAMAEPDMKDPEPEEDMKDPVSEDMGPDMGEPVEGPFEQLRGEVEVWRDSTGMMHVRAEYLEDLFFVNGYIHAQERLLQLEFYRRFASGRLAELAGGLDSGSIALDALMRTLGIKRNAVRAWEEEDKSTEGAIAVQSYSDGINAYLSQWRDGEVSPPLPAIVSPDLVDAWHPSDTFTVARLLAFDLTYIADLDIALTGLRQGLMETYNDEAASEAERRRAGIFHDLLRLAPATDARHIEELPDGGIGALRGAGPATRVSPALVDQARRLHQSLEGSETLRAFYSLDPRRLGTRGSNNWVLDGERTDSGHVNVANDPHLGLSLPTAFYPLHLALPSDGDGREPFEVIGASYVGLPGVVIGRTDEVAWGTTTGYYDYVDVYQEQTSGAASTEDPATVRFNEDDVPVEVVTETIGVGLLGSVTSEIEMTVEIVPHHGPILPRLGDDNRPISRPDDGEALSVKWVGLDVVNEVPFLLGIYRASTPEQVEEALDNYKVGSSNFVFGFTSGDIYYSGQSDIPVRAEEAMTFDPKEAPMGDAPIFVLPGDGAAEWTGFLDEADIPHALNPEKGYVITSNNDQIGETFDNNPFDGPHYYGGFYAAGFRGERIEELITGAQSGLSLDEQLVIQDDDLDPVGRRIVPFMVEAVDTVLDGSVADDAYPDLAALRAEIAGSEASLQEMRDLLDRWDYRAPATRDPEGDDADRSAATVLFNVALVYLQRDVLGDELARIGWYEAGTFELPVINQARIRALLYLLEQPEDDPSDMQTWDADNQESWVFDDIDTEDVVETRHTMMVRALLKARERLGVAEPFGEPFDGREVPSPASADVADWIWGRLHGLSLAPLVPAPLGPADQRPAEGLPFYSRPGGEFAVSPCNHDHDDFDFTCTAGSSLRMVHDMDPDGPVSYNSMPGGASADPDSPYFDNQLEAWNQGQALEMLWDFAAIEADAQQIWTFNAEGVTTSSE